MEESLSEVISQQFKKLLPLLCSAVSLLVSYIPVHLPFISMLRPDMGLICVFFWALYRQDLFNFGSAFVLGFLADCMSAAPLGLNVFVYLFIFMLCSTFGRFINMKPFMVNWCGFASVLAFALLIKWLLISFYYRQFLPLSGVAFSYGATLFWYPLIARLNMWIQNRYLFDAEAVYEQGQ